MSKTLRVTLNLVMLAVVAAFIWYMAASMGEDEPTYAETINETPFTSPYKQAAAFELPETISCFDLYNGKLFIAAKQAAYCYDTDGNRLLSFSIQPNARDIEAKDQHIYILYPTFIEVYAAANGELLHKWDACSELSDYCSFTITNGFVFVTDVENKNICKYTTEGGFVAFIESPRGFIIPSYSFDIANLNDTIYCVNSGRHLVESYTLDGSFIAAFGGPGAEAGSFVGCCNPAYITFTANGELLTSEKGNPRICSYTHKGVFEQTLLNSRLLGGGSEAYQAKHYSNRLFVAKKNTITVYSYNQKNV